MWRNHKFEPCCFKYTMKWRRSSDKYFESSSHFQSRCNDDMLIVISLPMCISMQSWHASKKKILISEVCMYVHHAYCRHFCVLPYETLFMPHLWLSKYWQFQKGLENVSLPISVIFLALYLLLLLRGYCTSGPYFWRLCAFSQKINQIWTKYPMDLVKNVPRNSKITVSLQCRPLLWSYSEKCAKINIFHVLNHKSITTWFSKILVQ